MNGIFKQAGRAASGHIPESVGRVPYAVALRALRLVLRSIKSEGKIEAWARNSYVLGTLRPLVSDLDVTIWFEAEPSGAQLRQLVRVLRWTSRAFPLLGEANIYVAPEARSLVAIANPFELARDPETLARLGEAGRSSDLRGQLAVQAAAFILRMLEGDLRNVLLRPEERRAKWDSHYAVVAGVAASAPNPIWKGFPDRTLLRGIVEVAVHLLELGDSENNREAVESLERYFECVGRDVPVHTLGMDEWWWALLPHRFCFGDALPPRLQGKMAEIFVAQLGWETWGILTQYRHAGLAPSKIRAHVEALARVLAAGAPDSSRGDVRDLSAALERLSKSL